MAHRLDMLGVVCGALPSYSRIDRLPAAPSGFVYVKARGNPTNDSGVDDAIRRGQTAGDGYVLVPAAYTRSDHMTFASAFDPQGRPVWQVPNPSSDVERGKYLNQPFYPCDSSGVPLSSPSTATPNVPGADKWSDAQLQAWSDSRPALSRFGESDYWPDPFADVFPQGGRAVPSRSPRTNPSPTSPASSTPTWKIAAAIGAGLAATAIGFLFFRRR